MTQSVPPRAYKYSHDGLNRLQLKTVVLNNNYMLILFEALFFPIFLSLRQFSQPPFSQALTFLDRYEYICLRLLNKTLPSHIDFPLQHYSQLLVSLAIVSCHVTIFVKTFFRKLLFGLPGKHFR